MNYFKRAGRVALRAAMNFNRDNGFDQAAVISYFSLLSVLPLSILLIALGAALIGSVDMAEQGVKFLLRDLVSLLGTDIFEQARNVGSRAGVLGWPFLLLSLWTASKVFSKVEGSLDRVFGVENRRSFPVRKIFAFGLVALLALVVLILVVVSGSLSAFNRFIDSTALAGVRSNPLYSVINNFVSRFVVPWCLTVFTFGFTYKVVPACPVPWQAAAGAGLVAGSLWELLKNLFTWYLGRFANYAQTYGAMEAVVVFIIWVNLSSVLLIWGGELAALLSGARNGTGSEAGSSVT